MKEKLNELLKVGFHMIGILIFISSIIMIKIQITPYTQKDADRVVDIYLGKVKPNVIDYIRLDMDRNGKITLHDGVQIINNL